VAVSALRAAPAWRAHLHACADAPPRRPRIALAWRGERIGSVEPELFAHAGLAHWPSLRRASWNGAPAWEVVGALTPALAQLALGLRDAGFAHTWRDEQLAVCNDAGVVLGTIERAAVRPLGIATHAVHLAALDARGRHWVQQRAFDKPTDPGLLDTTVGGLVPAGEPLHVALERESWEEAGLRPRELRAVRHAGRLLTRRPFRELAHGYVVEQIDFFVGALPDGVVPRNQDGEVAAFRCLAAEDVSALLEQDAFTIDAALVLVNAFG
jgi:8-oxo-dGTP pyrophosphatase MutT (NUDIX family)